MEEKNKNRRLSRTDRCYQNPEWNEEEKQELVCWACQFLMNGDKSKRRVCVNPIPWTKDSKALELKEWKGYEAEYLRMQKQKQR